MDKTGANVGMALVWLAFLNLAACAISTFAFGGDAWNGKVENGHYFVGHNKKFAEVSQAAYIFSGIAAGGLVITGPLGFCGLAYYALHCRYEAAAQAKRQTGT